MKLEEMQTVADALRWALRRIDTAGLGCGEYFDRAEALLNTAPKVPTQVYSYWPDGSRKYLEFDHWPQRCELPDTAVCFEMAVPDPALLSPIPQQNGQANPTPGAHIGSKDELGLAVKRALLADECQRLNDWVLIGLIQRAELEIFADRLRAEERERCAAICDVTPPDPFRPSIEAAHAIRNQRA